MFRLRSLFVVGMVLTLSPFLSAEPAAAPAGVVVQAEALRLQRGEFTVQWRLPTRLPVCGFFVLGSGDGGWSYWEERVAVHLAQKGWAVAGVDFARYSDTDYTQMILAKDFAGLVAELGRRVAEPGNLAMKPVIYGGWSTGAEESLPAAAITQLRPAGLRGLMLVAPNARGRFGLRASDKLGITPTGEGSFALADFAGKLHDVPMAQLHAGWDPLDSITWFKGKNVDVTLWRYPRAFHDFENASEAFLALFDSALIRLLLPPVLPEESR